MKTSFEISLWDTWNLKLSTTWKHLFHTPQTSKLKLSKNWRTFFHIWEFITFIKISSTPPTHLETLQVPYMPPLGNGLPFTLQPCKLKTFKRISPFNAIQAQNLSLLLILAQCPFSWLVWAHNLLEETWKQVRNERLKVHEMEQLY